MNERPDPEYGSDDWASRRGYELATHFGTTQSERMAQADDIADELKRLRDHYLAQVKDAQNWERVPDGQIPDSNLWIASAHGDGWFLEFGKNGAKVWFPDAVRLFLRPSPQEPTP